jgi:hypothetical protein
MATARSLARRDLECALETLGWIGALVIAADDRGGATAIRLTELGRAALDSANATNR